MLFVFLQCLYICYCISLLLVHLFLLHLEVVARQGRPVALRYSQIKPGHRPFCFFLLIIIIIITKDTRDEIKPGHRPFCFFIVIIIIIITKDRDKFKIKTGHGPFDSSLLSVSLSLSSLSRKQKNIAKRCATFIKITPVIQNDDYTTC